MGIPDLRFSHVGFLVRDIDRMIDFYGRHLGMQLTDRGRLHALPGEPEIAFLSRDPEEHHQLALVSGRDPSQEGTLNQISYRVGRLQDLRDLRAGLEADGVTRLLPMSHGNAWSLYFPDPEQNTIECFLPTPFHTRQPVTDALDLSLSDDEILKRTEARYRGTPDFQPRAEWQAAFAARLGLSRS
ncbi:MAG: VOC family protein [Myxococcota bacterium]